MLTPADYIALGLGYSWLLRGRTFFGRTSLTHAMSERRREWIYNSLRRDLKMIDTQIMAGLQNGTAFFASTSIFAIGSCFALLGATDKVNAIFADLPYVFHGNTVSFELKVGGLAALFAYAFFKFGWSYRLFNYCTILFGSIPMIQDAEADIYGAQRAAERVIRMNIIAGAHFNEGLRAIFLSIGYLGWFVNAYVFMATTATVVFVLTRRQFFSEARLAIMDLDPPPNLHLSAVHRDGPPAGVNELSAGGRE
jgi:uncharacterized membrane protein